MSGIAGIIHWNGEPVDRSDLDLMVGLMEHRGPDGIELDVSGPIGLAHAKMALRHEELNWRPQPVWLPNSSKAIVADARLYNRDDLLTRLGKVEWFRGPASDAEIILALFERYGDQTSDLLDGDYAFVIWDAEKHRVFAGRDPFGVRPLVFWAEGGRFVFASEPKQILALPYVPVVPDDLAVGEVLVNRYRDSSRTFYKDVRLLRPAHSLTASKDGWREARHWNPDPEKATSFSMPDECFELFRFHLKNAVARRLQIDYPAVAELSGGYDSSSVVVLAADAQRQGVISCPRIETLSAVYPGLSCDESEYSEAISEIVPFRRRTYVASETVNCIGAMEELHRVDAPYLHTPDGESLAMEENLREVGARVLLTGIGGDELSGDRAILLDLADSFQYKDLTRLLWAVERSRGKRAIGFPCTLLRLAVPSPLRWRFRRLVPRNLWVAPAWLDPVFAQRLKEYLGSATHGEVRFPSRVQQGAYDGLTGARAHRVFEVGERRRSHMLVEQRHPFLDRILVEFVLSIGHRDRIPQSGEPKFLLCRALYDDLPVKVRDRRNKTGFSVLRQLGVEGTSDRLLSSGSWASGAYVREETARLRLAPGFPTSVPWWPHTMVGVEWWLRNLQRIKIPPDN